MIDAWIIDIRANACDPKPYRRIAVNASTELEAVEKASKRFGDDWAFECVNGTSPREFPSDDDIVELPISEDSDNT